MAQLRPKLKHHPEGTILPVKVVPNASRDRIVGVLGGALKVATSCPPEKGKANQAVARMLAEWLHLPTRQVQLVSAPSCPRKEFLIRSLQPEAVSEALAGLL
ncbi:MAG: DUF167 domain-containing protein [Phycisphaerae bacterium]